MAEVIHHLVARFAEAQAAKLAAVALANKIARVALEAAGDGRELRWRADA